MIIQSKTIKADPVQHLVANSQQSNAIHDMSGGPIPSNIGTVLESGSSLLRVGDLTNRVHGQRHPFFNDDFSFSQNYQGEFDLDAILLDLKERIDRGERFSFVIGRGNKEKNCEANDTTWVYCDIDGGKMNSQEDKPHLWLNFDNKDHLNPVVSVLKGKIDHIVFDYSVLKFFDHFTSDVLPLLKDLLKIGGKLFIADLQQTIGIVENPLPLDQQEVFGSMTISPDNYLKMAQPFFDNMLEKVGIELDTSLASLYRKAKRGNQTEESYLDWAIEYLRSTGKFEEPALEAARNQSIQASCYSSEIYGQWLEAKKACLCKYFGQQSIEVREDSQYPISQTGQSEVYTCRYFVATKSLE